MRTKGRAQKFSIITSLLSCTLTSKLNERDQKCNYHVRTTKSDVSDTLLDRWIEFFP